MVCTLDFKQNSSEVTVNFPLRLFLISSYITVFILPAFSQHGNRVDRYVIQQGDSLIHIAQNKLNQIGITDPSLHYRYSKELASVNKIGNPNLIRAGSTIFLPEFIESHNGTQDMMDLLESELAHNKNTISQLSIKIEKMNDEVLALRSSFQEFRHDQNLNKQQKETSQFFSLYDRHLQESNMKIDQISQDFHTYREIVGRDMQRLESLVLPKSSVVWALVLLLICLGIISVGIWIIVQRNKKEYRLSQGRISSELETMRNSSIELETTIAKTLEAAMNASPSIAESPPSTAEPDHSFPLKVCEEIHRMKKRIENMTGDIKGIKALNNAVQRLEDELLDRGYEFVDLIGKEYTEGLLVHAKFIVVDNLDLGTQVITNIIKPQINFNNQIIKVADVEVSMGE
jgi:phage shock protein A